MALTFDAEHPDRPWCPPGNAERILGDARRGAGVRATFFLQGRWAKAHPDLARAHRRRRSPRRDTTRTTTRACRSSMTTGCAPIVDDGADAIRATAGVDPGPWFRCPFGAGHDDPRSLVDRSPSSATATSTGTSSSRTGSPGARAPTIARGRGRRGPVGTATAPSCSCTRGPAARATRSVDVIGGSRGDGATIRHGRRAGAGCRERRAAFLAVDGGGSKVGRGRAAARRHAPGRGARPRDRVRHRRRPGHPGADLAPRSTRRAKTPGSSSTAVRSATWGCSASRARTCPPTTGASPAGSAAAGWTADTGAAQRHLRRPAAPGPTVTWGVGLVCGFGTNCSGVAPDGRTYRFPALG